MFIYDVQTLRAILFAWILLMPPLESICQPEIYKLCYLPVSQKIKAGAEVAVYSVLQSPAVEDSIIVRCLVKHLHAQALAELEPA